MAELVLAIVGVAGTLTAGIVGSLLQRKTQERVERLQHQRRTTDQQAASLQQFARYVVDYRRAQLVVWYQVEDGRQRGEMTNADTAPASAEMRQARSESWTWYYAVRLVWGDDDVVSGAAALLDRCSDLQRASNEEQLNVASDAILDSLNALVDKARKVLTHRDQ
ncbi:MAG: hypothetical protein ACRDOY_05745 [Nocardioidaceae bacterium]